MSTSKHWRVNRHIRGLTVYAVEVAMEVEIMEVGPFSSGKDFTFYASIASSGQGCKFFAGIAGFVKFTNLSNVCEFQCFPAIAANLRQLPRI